MAQKSSLTLLNFEQISKSKRFFWVIKPKEPIQWEFFDLKLTLMNNTHQRFDGGVCKFVIQGSTTHCEYTLEIPPIEAHRSATATKVGIRITEPGYHALTSIRINDRDGKPISCEDLEGDDVADPGNAYPLWLATREEIYQEYAVLIALATSILATILTIVNVIITILK
jgi:hypothetical protein